MGEKTIPKNPYPENITDEQWVKLNQPGFEELLKGVVNEMTERAEGRTPSGPNMIVFPEAPPTKNISTIGQQPEMMDALRGSDGEIDFYWRRWAMQTLDSSDLLTAGKKFRKDLLSISLDGRVSKTEEEHAYLTATQNFDQAKTSILGYMRMNHPSLFAGDFGDEIGWNHTQRVRGNISHKEHAERDYDLIMSTLEDHGLITVNQETGKASSVDESLNKRFTGRDESGSYSFGTPPVGFVEAFKTQQQQIEKRDDYIKNLSADEIIRNFEHKNQNVQMPEGLKQVIRDNRDIITNIDQPLNFGDLGMLSGNYGESVKQEFISQADWYTDFMAGEESISSIDEKDFEQVLKTENSALYEAYKSGDISRDEMRGILKKSNSSVGIGKDRGFYQTVTSPETADIDSFPVYGEEQLSLATDIISNLYKDQDVDVGGMAHFDSTGKYWGIQSDKLSGVIGDSFRDNVNVGDCYLGACYVGRNPQRKEVMGTMARAFDATQTIGQISEQWGTGGLWPYKERSREMGENIGESNTRAFVNSFFQSGAKITGVSQDYKQSPRERFDIPLPDSQDLDETNDFGGLFNRESETERGQEDMRNLINLVEQVQSMNRERMQTP